MRTPFAAVLLLAGAAFANTLSVGPGKTYANPCDAIAVAQAGDLIEVDAAGNYAGDYCSWSTDNLTIRGINGRAKIDDTGVTFSNGKGIFVTSANNATIENFELAGASVVDMNGAGIRFQGTNLTVRNCFFHDNEDGILSGPPTDGTGDILIENSEFAHNGAGDGFSHNMYIGHSATFTLRYSYSHDSNVGHLVKTRAAVNTIVYNRLTDENGDGSYEVNVPNGGTTYLIGNLIEQSAASQNHAIIDYASEGPNAANPDQHLFVINNTVLNHAGAGTFVQVAAAAPNAVLENNIFTGPGTVTNQAGAMQTTNWTDAMGAPQLVDPANFDFHLQMSSPCIDVGTAPGSNGSFALTPDHHYVHPISSEQRAVAGNAIDIGAYEFNGGGGTDGGMGGGAGGGGGSAAGGGSGGGAGVGGGVGGGSATGGGVGGGSATGGGVGGGSATGGGVGGGSGTGGGAAAGGGSSSGTGCHCGFGGDALVVLAALTLSRRRRVTP